MALDRVTVQRIAHLARIRVPEEALDGLAGELSNIMGWIEQLEEVDTADVEPMTSVVAMDAPKRDDVVSDGNYSERVLANAPAADDEYFAVPKVVE